MSDIKTEFPVGSIVETTQHDPAFGFGPDERGRVTGHDVIKPEPTSETQFEPYEVVIVQFEQPSADRTETPPQSVKPEYLRVG